MTAPHLVCIIVFFKFNRQRNYMGNSFGTIYVITLVPALGDPRRERPPAVYGHVINVPTHVNVKLPAIGGHLPNADADSHLLVVRTCYNGQCKQMPRFGGIFNPKSLAARTPTNSSLKFPCCHLVTASNISYRE